VRKKNLSSPFSTGGGGVHFEAHVQASFVVLMLTGGYAPCLPCWPIVEIKLQSKVDGFETDDLVVVAKNASRNERRKLLVQVKHSIGFTRGNALLGEVMQAAWNDFHNPKVFTRDKDIIALITGPLNKTDTHNVHSLLNQARHTKNVDEFFRNIQLANFSTPRSTEKLEVIQHHLKAANSGNDVSREELYDFLNHFHLLGYDFGKEKGVVLSLLHSHLSQFQLQYPEWAWSRVVDIVQAWNQDAGTITPNNLPEDLVEAFKKKTLEEMPEELKLVREKPKTDWTKHPEATYLALVVLIGGWQDKSSCDLEVITQLLGISCDEWLKKAREILHHPDSPLSLRNGIWKVVNRADLWNILGSRIFDQDLEMFRSLAVSVLKKPDPSFKLLEEERYAAKVYGKVPEYSHVLRKGIAEGLAMIGSQPDSCRNCSHGKAEATCVWVIRELLKGADWVLWGSLNGVLPTLAESSPDEFLGEVEKTMRLTPCPFDELFSQENNGITCRNYFAGLLWALEGLAWEEINLVRVCVILGELACHDPGSQNENRPFNSLATILLPWLPQTLASSEKRKVAVEIILKEWPDIGWNLILQLLPGQHQLSSGSHKPSWRKIIPEGWEIGITRQEYWQQVSIYAELAVTAAGQDSARLSTLIDHFDSLPNPSFERLLQVLSSQSISELPEEQRLPIWIHLSRLINKHRRFSKAKWALPDELITRIEKVSEHLAPTNPFDLYQNLFSDRDFDLYEENGDWEEQRKKLYMRRETAIFEIFQQNGPEGVIRFAESVSSPGQVGYALGVIADDVIEQSLLPHFLESADNKRKELVSGFIWRRYHTKGWDWCDNIEKSNWTPEQVGQFLACLPFSKETWDRVSEWLQKDEREYWTRTRANAYQTSGDLATAIDKLIEHGRPHAAISFMIRIHHAKQPIDTSQCVHALLATLSSSEPNHDRDANTIVELITLLQRDPSVDKDALFQIEWAYLPLLSRQIGATPQLLENRLANDPEFFCEVIRMVYRSKKQKQPSKEPAEESKEIAANAFRLLYDWKTPPGTQKDGTFSEKHFTNWLQRVKVLCAESGHLEVSLPLIGEVLINAPAEPEGLWINRAVASALNDREADGMRNGFRTGSIKSRGVHWVEPTGKPERVLADLFRRKAEETENAGFHRFALTLRCIADFYDREAEHIISDHQQEEEG